MRDDDLNAAALTRMSAWVAAIADNLNNPIAGVNAALTILERALADDDPATRRVVADDAVRRIRDRLAMLGDYVAELIDVTRPSPVQPAPVDVRQLFAEIGTTLAPRHQPAVAYTAEAAAETLFADGAKLRAVLKALIANAAEAAALGSSPPRIRLSARSAERGAQAGTVVTVEDSGPGFAPSVAMRASEPFYSTKEAGTGLGLAVAKRFADAHAGCLELGDSPALGGAAVSIFLPNEDSRRPT